MAQAGIFKDVSYDQLAAERLDIYSFRQAKNAPVMVFVHGGGWRNGDKKNVGYRAKAFTQAGYIYVSVEYPLLPDHPVGVQAQSVADAIAWVEKNIGRYGGDSKRIHIMGHSAGAHLVALVGVDGTYLEKAGASKDVVKSVIPVDGGGYDIPWRLSTYKEKRWKRRMDRVLEDVYTEAFGSDPAQWEDYSPIHHVKKGAYIPPYLMVYDAGSNRVEYPNKHFSAVVRAAGGRAELAPIEGRNHLTINGKMGALNDPVFKVILEFIE